TRTIIDGHGPLEAAVKENLKAVPVLLLNVSKDEELLLLQNLDSIQAMGSPNAKKIKELIAHNEATLAKLKETNTKALAKLNESLKDHATILAVKKKTPKTIYEVTNRIAKRRELREEDNFELSSRENKAVQEVYRDDATFECD